MQLPEYAFPSEAFRNAIDSLPVNYRYLIVFHFSRNNLPYLLEWVQKVPVLGVISIPYSEQPEVKAQIERFAPVHSPKLEDISSCILDICNQNSDAKIVIVEIGGYSAPISDQLHNVVLAVEDTTRGHERFKEYEKKLTYPVVSIARTDGKKKEDDPVGRAIAISADRIAIQLGKTLSDLNVTVLGYGGVGLATAKYCRELGANVTIYDPDLSRMAQAEDDGFKKVERNILLSGSDMIIGCSGYQSIQLDDIATLKNGVILLSGSSRQVEFPYADFKEMASPESVTDIIESFAINERTIYLVYKAQPVNLYFDLSLGDIFDIPMTLLVKSINYGLSHPLGHRLHELPS